MSSAAKYNPPDDPPQAHAHPRAYPGPSYAAPGSSSTTNVIVVNQPPGRENRLIIGQVDGHRDWSSDLCACMSDTGGCLWTVCCTSCVLADISAKLRENVCVTCCVPGGVIALRARLRTLGGIQGSICNDCCTVACCYFCALCQMSRELTVMGL